MDLSHITSQSLRRILNLTERKDELVKLVAEIETEISHVLTGVAKPVATLVGAGPKPARKGKQRGTQRKGKSGSVKEKILAVLEAAGATGLKVKEVAEKIGSPATNVSVWFSTTGKKLTKKLEPGRYALKGAAAAPSAKPSPAKSAATAKVKKTGKKAAPLKDRVLTLLNESGPKGMRVKDIASKLGLPGGNISVWISTTGKTLVEKVEPGVYAAKEVKSAQPAPAKVKTRAKRKSKKPASASKPAFKLSKTKGKTK